MTFSAGDFTKKGAGGWTVDALDVKTYAWVCIGNTMTVAFAIGLN